MEEEVMSGSNRLQQMITIPTLEVIVLYIPRRLSKCSVSSQTDEGPHES